MFTTLVKQAKSVFAVSPGNVPKVQNAYICEVSYEPMEIKTLLMRHGKKTNAGKDEFNQCVIGFMLEDGTRANLIETRRTFRLVATADRPKNITAGAKELEKMYRRRRPGQIIRVALDKETGEYYLAGS